MAKGSTPANTRRISKRRPYESRVRRAQIAETQARILAAGSALAHQASSWDWSSLTIRAVAAKAGVSERTVYRYFATERQFHEALTRCLEQEAGVRYEGMRLEDLPNATSRMFGSLPSFAAVPTAKRTESNGMRDHARRESLLKAVRDITPTWSDAEHQMAAAAIDVLWMPPAYERLVSGWGLDTAGATRAVTWAISALVRAIHDGTPPEAHLPESNQAGKVRTRKRKASAT